MASSTSTSRCPASLHLSIASQWLQTNCPHMWVDQTARFHSPPTPTPTPSHLLCLAEWVAHYQHTHRHIAASRIASSCVESIVFALWFVKRKTSCLSLYLLSIYPAHLFFLPCSRYCEIRFAGRLICHHMPLIWASPADDDDEAWKP